MKIQYLLPNKFKKIGWLIFIPVSLLGILWLIFEPLFESKLDLLEFNVFALVSGGILNDTYVFQVIENNILDEFIGVLFIISSIFIAFSKEKTEDEFIAMIRLESLVWATYINYGVLILALIFVYDIPFFWVLVFNMFTTLIFFIIRYNWALNNSKKSIENEK